MIHDNYSLSAFDKTASSICVLIHCCFATYEFIIRKYLLEIWLMARLQWTNSMLQLLQCFPLLNPSFITGPLDLSIELYYPVNLKLNWSPTEKNFKNLRVAFMTFYYEVSTSFNMLDNIQMHCVHIHLCFSPKLFSAYNVGHNTFSFLQNLSRAFYGYLFS